MMKPKSKSLRRIARFKTALRSAPFAVLACSLVQQHANAQSNRVEGTIFGTNLAALAEASSIASLQDGSGSLEIGHTNTVELVLSNNIAGFVLVSNHVDGLTIKASGGTLVNDEAEALKIMGGENLVVTGGLFRVEEGQVVDNSVPPIPGQQPSTKPSSPSPAVVMEAVTNALLTDVSIEGATFNPSSTRSIGTDALRVFESDSIRIENGLLSGGDGDDVATGTSVGGNALYAENSSLSISNGVFSGGDSGTAAAMYGGAALFATNSTVEIEGSGTFRGGSDAPAIFARNSDLTIRGGSFEGGGSIDSQDSYYGLVSMVDNAMSNNIVLDGGSINSIDFTGDGTQLLSVGSEMDVDGYIVLDGSVLIVEDNQSDSAFQNLLLRSGEIEFEKGYTLGADGHLEFVVVSNDFVALQADTATFETNGSIFIDTSRTSFDYGTNDLALVTTESGIYIVDANGTTNAASTGSFSTNINVDASVIGRTRLSGVLVDDTNLVVRFNTLHMKDYLEATGKLGALVEEMEPLMPEEMTTIIDQIDDPAVSGNAIHRTYFTTFNNYQAAIDGMRAAVGQSISRGTEFRDQIKLVPPGANGPQPNNKLRGWSKYHGDFSSRGSSGLNPGFDTILHGGVVGVDTSFGNLLLGVSGGSSHYRISYENQALSEAVAYHGSLFGTYGMDRSYIDAGIAYGQHQVNTRTALPFRLDGSFDSDTVLGYLGGGYDLIDIDGATIFTPVASFQYAAYNQDAYAERSSTAVPRMIGGFDAESFLSTMGMNISTLNEGRFDTFDYKVDLRMHWLHEFSPDPSSISFALQNGGAAYRLSPPSMDEDLYRIGLGFTFFNSQPYQPKNVMLRLDFDELFGADYNSHNVSAKLLYAF